MSRVALQNRRKYKRIFSDTVNICLDSLQKDEHYYVSRLGCSPAISPLSARLSIKLSGYMKEIIKDIESETFDDTVIKRDDDFFIVDENEEFEMNDVNDSDQEDNKCNLQRRLDPLLIEENNSRSTTNTPINENITPRDPDVAVDKRRSAMPAESSAIKIDSVKTFKDKQLISRGFLRKKNCPKAIPIRKRVRDLETISSNVDEGKPEVSQPVDESSSSTANKNAVIEENSSQLIPEHIIPHVIISELPLRQQSSSKATNEQQFEMKKVDADISKLRYIAESDSDNDDNITLVINKKTKIVNKQSPTQTDDELEEFSPDDSDDTTMTTKHAQNKQPKRVTRSSNERSPNQQPVRVTRSSVRLTKSVIKYNLCSSTSEDDKTLSSSSDKSDSESETLSKTTTTATKKNNSVKRQRPKRGGNKKALSQTTIHHRTWTLQNAKKRGRYNGKSDLEKMKFWSQKRADIDKLNKLVYAKCIELKNEKSIITDGKIQQIAIQIKDKILPKNFQFARVAWCTEFLNKYNITGKPAHRLIN